MLEHAMVFLSDQDIPPENITGTGLTCYVGTCKGHLSDQDISSENITDNGLTTYVATCKGHLSDQDILSKKSQALDSQPMLQYAKVV